MKGLVVQQTVLVLPPSAEPETVWALLVRALVVGTAADARKGLRGTKQGTLQRVRRPVCLTTLAWCL